MKQKISIAANSLKPKDLSRTHYTTMGFGCPFPVFAEEAINKDKFRLRVSNFSRLTPMALPNLGTLSLKMHAFYVPFRLVWNHFENFRDGLPSWNSKGAWVYKNTPLIDDVQLTGMFITESSRHENLSRRLLDSAQQPTSITDSIADFMVYESTFSSSQTNGYVGYEFTERGKQVYHMLTALGYNFKFITQDSVTTLGMKNTTYSALPLLCWFKIFLDYYIPSQFQPSSRIHQLLNTIHDMDSQQLQTPISFDLFQTAFDEITLYYQNNYFTSAWMSPNAPVPGLNNIGSTTSDTPIINDVRSQGNESVPYNQPVTNNSNGVEATAVEKYNVLTSDGLTFLQKFARFVKRSNFAGSRAVERILARFGVRVDDFQIGMCRYLGSETVTLQKSDVTVTGNTEQAGDFVGKGFFSGGSNRVFKCDCDLAGMVFVCASLETPSVYLDGVRRRNLHMTPLDFYTPELDGGTMQAISGCELYHRDQWINGESALDYQSLGLNYDQTFGFTPRYSEYKFALDDISGDFAILSRSRNIDPFILPRRLFNDDEMYEVIKHTGDYETYRKRYETYDRWYHDNSGPVTPVRTLFSNDQYQFNRIFKDLTGGYDPVFSVFRIDCLVNSVSMPLNESAEIQGRGKSLDFETNGVHLS